MKDTRICTIDGCNKKHRSNGFCLPHYNVERSHGGSLYIETRERSEAENRRAFQRCLDDAGWTEERFNAFNYAQGGLCYLCGGVSYYKGQPRRLCMDHHHETNKPRGLLCQTCNQFLWFYEDPDRASMAEQYLGRK